MSFLCREDDVDDRVDVGDVDFGVTVDVGVRIGITRQDGFDNHIHIGNIDLTIPIHITRDNRRFFLKTGIMAIQGLEIQFIFLFLSVLVKRKLDGLDIYRIGAHIVNTAQFLEVEQEQVVDARFKRVAAIFRVKPDGVGLSLEIIAGINLDVIDRHRRIKDESHCIGKTEKHQVLSHLNTGRPIGDIVKGHVP